MSSRRFSVLAALLWAVPWTPATAQVYLANITAPRDGLSSTCISVLNQQVACDPRILEVDPSIYEDDAVINGVCTTACTNALTLYQRRVQGSCGTSRYDGGDGWMYLATYSLQLVLEKYRAFCLQDSAGNRCQTVLRDQVFSADPVNGAITAMPSATAFCNACFLSSMKLEQEHALGPEPGIKTHYESLTSSCRSTSGFAVTTPVSTTWVTRASNAPEPVACEGTEYTIRSGDTCQSVSLAQGINTNQLLNANNLHPYCGNFPSSGKICIPAKDKCKPHKLTASDHCRTVATKNDVSWAQVVSWNDDVGKYCENIAALVDRGFVLCASNPGGSWVNPHPEFEPEEEPLAPTTAEYIEYGQDMTTFTGSLPTPSLGNFLPNLGYLAPLANGTRNDCFRYESAPVIVSSVNSTSTDLCADVARIFGITMGQLTEWNPDLFAVPGPGGACTLRRGFRYCVLADQVKASTMTKFCVHETQALPGWECESVLRLLKVPLARFVEWNPVVGSSCDNYKVGHTYCTAVEGFRPSGTISTCNRWEVAATDDPDDDPCGQIERKFNLQHARFVAWNPSVTNSCSGIVEGYEYCVGTPSFPAPGG